VARGLVWAGDRVDPREEILLNLSLAHPEAFGQADAGLSKGSGRGLWDVAQKSPKKPSGRTEQPILAKNSLRTQLCIFE
jgi:hypothetical protein